LSSNLLRPFPFPRGLWTLDCGQETVDSLLPNPAFLNCATSDCMGNYSFNKKL
jgi:hypothetical protein